MGEETNLYGRFFDADGKPLGDNMRTVTLHADKFEVVEHRDDKYREVEIEWFEGERSLEVKTFMRFGELMEIVERMVG